jgi:hypothetical protein
LQSGVANTDEHDSPLGAKAGLPQGERDDGAHLAVWEAAVAAVKRCDAGDRHGVTKRKQSSGAVPT